MPPRTRIPTESDFAPLTTGPPNTHLHTSLVFPSPRESTTSILILFHGLGDSEASFASFASSMRLPGVLAISVRGVNPLPASLLSDDDGGFIGAGNRHFHWGDDLRLGSGGGNGEGELDQDPGFEMARRAVMERLVRGVLVEGCGWTVGDVILFGFGQGGGLALGLASKLRDDGDGDKGKAFKGVVSVGGALPGSMVPSVSGRGKAKTPVLVCHGRGSEVVDEEAVEVLRSEFEDVRVVEWKRGDDGMPRNREEVLPMMQFFAERLRSGWS